jgi:anti-sigma B factor antagonist
VEFFKRRTGLASEVTFQYTAQTAQCHVSLSGRITVDSAPDLRVLLLQRIDDRNCTELYVDLDEIAYIDSSGIAILIELLKAARAQGKNLHLNRVREQPRQLLEALRLLRLFDPENTQAPPADPAHSEILA